MPHMTPLLIIDDDAELCTLLSEFLAREGFGVVVEHDGARGLELALNGNFALIVLDLMLPSLDGFALLKQLRTSSRVPVLMLTARGEDVDRIVGLELGADDYLAKPFNPRELAARIQAVLRRSTATTRDAAQPGPRQINLGDVELDEGARTVRRQNQEVELTSVEFDLLAFFMKNPVKVLERDEIVKQILGRESAPDDRSIDVHISNLRKKLGRAADGSDRIRAIRGIGYIFVIPVKSKSR